MESRQREEMEGGFADQHASRLTSDELQSQNDKLVMENKNLSSLISVLQLRNNALQKELTRRGKSEVSSEYELKLEDDQISQLQNGKGEMEVVKGGRGTKQGAKTRAQMNALRLELAVIKGEKMVVEEKLKSVEREKEMISARNAETIQVLKDQISLLKERLEKESADITMEKMQEDSRSVIKEWKTRNADLKNVIDDQRKEIAEYKKKVEMLESSVENFTHTFEKQLQDIIKAEAEKLRAVREAEDAAKRLEEMRAEKEVTRFGEPKGVNES
jgi:chromosome segregation ATPase